MAPRLNGSLRGATNVADSSDDVDVGWDDLPAPVTEPPPAGAGVSPKVSEIRALSPSFPHVASSPHPSPSNDAASRQSELPNASELEVPNFRRHQVNPTVIVAAIGAAVALIVASVASPQFPNVAAARHEVRVALPEAPPAEPPPEPPRAEPAPPPTVTVAEAPAAAPGASAASAAPAAQSPVETARENAVAVTIKVFPENSVVFRAGEKLGYGTLQVSVEHDAKQRLTALHDGYLPFNFTVDGSRDTVVVRLKQVPSPEASATSAGDSPPSDGDAHQAALPPSQAERQPDE